MTKIRASTLERRIGISGEERVTTRVEVSWSQDSLGDKDFYNWVNLGLHYYDKCAWDLILSLFVLGARRGGIEFEHVDMTKEGIANADPN